MTRNSASLTAISRSTSRAVERAVSCTRWMRDSRSQSSSMDTPIQNARATGIRMAAAIKYK